MSQLDPDVCPICYAPGYSDTPVRIACIVITTDTKRAQLWARVVPSVREQGFDDIVVVGDWPDTSPYADVRYFNVAHTTRTTIEALQKRDVGTLATTADILVYLCDDHVLAPRFGDALRTILDEPWDVVVPNRYTTPTHDGLVLIPLNNGEAHGYCGGHGGVFRRHVITDRPWSTYEHHPAWDALSSAEQRMHGVRFCWRPRTEISIIDLNPNDPRHELPDAR